MRCFQFAVALVGTVGGACAEVSQPHATAVVSRSAGPTTPPRSVGLQVSAAGSTSRGPEPESDSAVDAHADVVQTADDASTTEAQPDYVKCEESCQGCKLLHDSWHWKRDSHWLSRSEKALVLAAFREYLASEACEAADPLPASQIGKDGDHSQVLSVTRGAFTAKQRRQTLVLYLTAHCGRISGHSEDWGARLVVLLEGDRRLGTFVDQRAPSVFWTADIDDDGIDEVIALGGWAGAGGSNAWVEPRSYASTSPRPLAYFDTDENACSFGAQDYWGSLVFARTNPDHSTCFLQRRSTRPCPAQHP